jgi:hypothetical protein
LGAPVGRVFGGEGGGLKELVNCTNLLQIFFNGEGSFTIEYNHTFPISKWLDIEDLIQIYDVRFMIAIMTG